MHVNIVPRAKTRWRFNIARGIPFDFEGADSVRVADLHKNVRVLQVLAGQVRRCPHKGSSEADMPAEMIEARRSRDMSIDV